MNQEPRELIIGINNIEALMKYGKVDFETSPISFRLDIRMLLKIVSHSESLSPHSQSRKRIAKVLDFIEKDCSVQISLELQNFESS